MVNHDSIGSVNWHTTVQIPSLPNQGLMDIKIRDHNLPRRRRNRLTNDVGAMEAFCGQNGILFCLRARFVNPNGVSRKRTLPKVLFPKSWKINHQGLNTRREIERQRSNSMLFKKSEK